MNSLLSCFNLSFIPGENAKSRSADALKEFVNVKKVEIRTIRTKINQDDLQKIPLANEIQLSEKKERPGHGHTEGIYHVRFILEFTAKMSDGT